MSRSTLFNIAHTYRSKARVFLDIGREEPKLYPHRLPRGNRQRQRIAAIGLDAQDHDEVVQRGHSRRRVSVFCRKLLGRLPKYYSRATRIFCLRAGDGPFQPLGRRLRLDLHQQLFQDTHGAVHFFFSRDVRWQEAQHRVVRAIEEQALLDSVQDQLLAKIVQLAATPVKVEDDPLPIRFVVPPKAAIDLWDSGMPVFARPGDTLQTIAATYHVPLWSVTQINKGAERAPLVPGERVVVPRHLAPLVEVSGQSPSRH